MGRRLSLTPSFARAEGRSAAVGRKKAGNGVKVMAIVDRCVLPLSIGTGPAQRPEAKLVQLRLDLVPIEELPGNLVGGRAYDSDPLDAEVEERGVEMITPRGIPDSPQDARRAPPLEAKRRWLVERFFAWIQRNRHVLIRWELHAKNFLGFVQLAALCPLLKPIHLLR